MSCSPSKDMGVLYNFLDCLIRHMDNLQTPAQRYSRENTGFLSNSAIPHHHYHIQPIPRYKTNLEDRSKGNINECSSKNFIRTSLTHLLVSLPPECGARRLIMCYCFPLQIILLLRSLLVLSIAAWDTPRQ